MMLSPAGHGLDGGTGNDSLIGSDRQGDRLVGGTGDDRLIGGGGDDLLTGGAGKDELDGGDGRDRASYASETVGVVIDLLYPNFNSGSALGDVLERIEVIDGSLTASDRISGDDATNWLNGLGGNDILDGRGGADVLRGGAGNDVYEVDNLRDRVIEVGGEGVDRVNSSVNYTLGADIENLSLIGAARTGIGNFVGNTIIGNAQANLIDGGFASDTLTGGAGADVFQFSITLSFGPNDDAITDFVSGTDKLQLSRGVFSALAVGRLSAAAFHQGTVANDTSDRIIFNPANGTLYYDADGNGAQGQTAFAHVTNGAIVVASDILVI